MSSPPNPILSLGISRGPSAGRPFEAAAAVAGAGEDAGAPEPAGASDGGGTAAEIDGRAAGVLFISTLMLGTTVPLVPLVSDGGLEGGFGGGMLSAPGGGRAWLGTRGLRVVGGGMVAPFACGLECGWGGGMRGDARRSGPYSGGVGSAITRGDRAGMRIDPCGIRCGGSGIWPSNGWTTRS